MKRVANNSIVARAWAKCGLVAVVLTGCAANTSSPSTSSSSTSSPSGSSPFVGTYTGQVNTSDTCTAGPGSGHSSTATVAWTVTISSTGAVSGSASQTANGITSNYTLTGSVTSAGQASLEVAGSANANGTNVTSSETLIGTFSLNGGRLVGTTTGTWTSSAGDSGTASEQWELTA